MKNVRLLCVASVVAAVGLCPHAAASDDAGEEPVELQYVVVEVANVRTGPGTAHDIVLKARWGDELEVLSTGIHWLRILHRDSETTGWIHGKLVSTERPTKRPPAKSQREGKGKYGRHTYTYLRDGDRYAVTFRPFLPRDDGIVIGAMLEVINNVYGKHLGVDLTPELVPREGANLVRFKGKKHYYYFLLIKEDTGEVHSFMMWRERR